MRCSSYRHKVKRLESEVLCCRHKVKRLESEVLCCRHKVKRLESEVLCCRHKVKRLESEVLCCRHKVKRLESEVLCCRHSGCYLPCTSKQGSHQLKSLHLATRVTQLGIGPFLFNSLPPIPRWEVCYNFIIASNHVKVCH